MKVHTLHVGGAVETQDLAKLPSRGDLQQAVGGYIEYVAVLFNGKRSTMIVNETGAIQIPPLPENARATLIYWTATMRGITPADFDPLEGPIIRGNAVLFDGVRKEDL